MSDNLSNFGAVTDISEPALDLSPNVKPTMTISENDAETPLNAGALKDLSDREIVQGLKASGNKGRKYQNEFYGRFAPYIYKVAVHRCYIFDDEDEFAKEITQLTFIKAFEAIHKFKVEAVVTEKVYGHLLKGWLGTIANNNFNKLYLDYRNHELNPDTLVVEEPPYDMFAALFDPTPEEQPSDNLILIRGAMDKLKEIDKHIITTYANEGCLNTTKHLSDDTMRILCEIYKTTSENIRQRKNRALKKIRSYCIKH